jgi:23S rRNA (adenine2503-C2)-methyltransferase
LLAIEKESGERIDNIVFMGMGEPLANLTNLLRAIRIINAWGLEIGARRNTISTSGLARRFASSRPSRHSFARHFLHGANDEVRNQVMPVNRKYNLATLSACDFTSHTKRLMANTSLSRANDSDEQAQKLARHVAFP